MTDHPHALLTDCCDAVTLDEGWPCQSRTGAFSRRVNQDRGWLTGVLQVARDHDDDTIDQACVLHVALHHNRGPKLRARLVLEWKRHEDDIAAFHGRFSTWCW